MGPPNEVSEYRRASTEEGCNSACCGSQSMHRMPQPNGSVQSMVWPRQTGVGMRAGVRDKLLKGDMERFGTPIRHLGHTCSYLAFCSQVGSTCGGSSLRYRKANTLPKAILITNIYLLRVNASSRHLRARIALIRSRALPVL